MGKRTVLPRNGFKICQGFPCVTILQFNILVHSCVNIEGHTSFAHIYMQTILWNFNGPVRPDVFAVAGDICSPYNPPHVIHFLTAAECTIGLGSSRLGPGCYIAWITDRHPIGLAKRKRVSGNMVYQWNIWHPVPRQVMFPQECAFGNRAPSPNAWSTNH